MEITPTEPRLFTRNRASQTSSMQVAAFVTTREITVSEKTGDKSRFGRERRAKILRRQKVRELQKALGAKKDRETERPLTPAR